MERRMYGREQRREPRRKGGRKKAGPGGKCLCPECGHKVEHITGKPCFETKCPKCGALMTRE